LFKIASRLLLILAHTLYFGTVAKSTEEEEYLALAMEFRNKPRSEKVIESTVPGQP